MLARWVGTAIGVRKFKGATRGGLRGTRPAVESDNLISLICKDCPCTSVRCVVYCGMNLAAYHSLALLGKPGKPGKSGKDVRYSLHRCVSPTLVELGKSGKLGRHVRYSLH